MNLTHNLTSQGVKRIIIAVDGPAASGKSSVSKAVAKSMGLKHVNTGALYRALAVVLRREGIALDSSQSLEALARTLPSIISELRWDPLAQSVFFRGENLGKEMFDEDLGPYVSKVAGTPLIRTLLVEPQRVLALSEENGAVLDGRDIGTVIFPDADVKIFLTASIEERARRRLAQARGVIADAIDARDPELAPLIDQIRIRDEGDYSRSVAPLVKAQDAYALDTTGIAFEEVVVNIYNYAKEKLISKFLETNLPKPCQPSLDNR